MMKHACIPLLFVSAFAIGANPPAQLNYQGVLRDASSAPLTGSYDMRFRFFDSLTGGNEILIDSHLAANSQAVVVSGGLFSTALGAGEVSDGSGPGTFTSLAQVFRDHTEVYLETQIGVETLTPRVRVLGAAYAENATALDGRSANSFLDTSSNTQTKAGTLNAGSLQVSGSTFEFPAFATRMYSGTTGAAIYGGSEAGDKLDLISTDAAGVPYRSRISLYGSNNVTLVSSNGYFTYYDGNGEIMAQLDPGGQFNIDGEFYSQFGSVRLGTNGSVMQTTVSGMLLDGGIPTASILDLRASGSTPSRANILIRGDSELSLTSGNGSFSFRDGVASGNETARLSAAGDLQLDGDLTIDGADLRLSRSSANVVSRVLNNYDVEFRMDEDDNSPNSWFRFFTNGGTVEQLRIVDGDEAPAYFDGAVNANGLDFAEAFSIDDPTLTAGDVVVFDRSRPGFVQRASEEASALLAGVISGDPGFLTGSSFTAEENAAPELALQRARAIAAGDVAAERALSVEMSARKQHTQRAVALIGRLPVKVDGRYGPIHPGDPLTSSPTAGHAMVLRDSGLSLGVALESWERNDTGTILVFVQRGWYASGTAARQSSERVAPTAVTASESSNTSVVRTAAVAIHDEPVSENVSIPAELFESVEALEPGELVALDALRAGFVRRVSSGYDALVLGVIGSVSGSGVQHGAGYQVQGQGIARLRVDASFGAVRIGDLLTSSPTPGHAMLARAPLPGTVIAKALEPLERDAGVIRVMIMPR
jgi:hypothetical protein